MPATMSAPKAKTKEATASQETASRVGRVPELVPGTYEVEAFFLGLQFAAKGYIALNATKTGVVYRLHDNPPQSHE